VVRDCRPSITNAGLGIDKKTCDVVRVIHENPMDANIPALIPLEYFYSDEFELIPVKPDVIRYVSDVKLKDGQLEVTYGEFFVSDLR